MKRKYKNDDLNNGEPVEVSACPKCDKKVVKVRKYKNGDWLFIHEERIKDKPFPHIEIVDCCYVKAEGGAQ